ncbi:GMC oxidoreductase [Nannocystaceae bacterium ST9]
MSEAPPSSDDFDTDVVVIGSGFGGSVAALRFAEAGERVVVLERGAWISREGFHGNLDFFWMPRRNRFGMNELRSRGKTITPWLGAAVGGGSHVYAGTLKRCDDWTGFPAAIAHDDMRHWYEVAEAIMRPLPYPDWSPYADNRTSRLLFETAARLRTDATLADPDDPVVDAGAVALAISFAPPGVSDEEFVNVHGARQRYHHPGEQAIFGGDIDAKNSLDKNYLHLAQARGAEIRAMCEAERIEPLAGGGYRIDYKRWVGEPTATRRWLRRWFPSRIRPSNAAGSITARRVVVAAGCVGSTELLLRARDRHRTLPSLSPALGRRYTTNGNFISLMLPFRCVWLGWLSLLVALVGLALHSGWLVGLAAIGYLATVVFSRGPFDPDLGTTNSDYLRFRGPEGVVYVESGRYPTPDRLAAALVLAAIGRYRPHRYRAIVRISGWLRALPPFSLLARSWPIPLLQMGRDHAVGRFELDAEGDAVIDYDVEANQDFYAYLDRLGKRVARAAKAYWLPNGLFRLTGRLEVSHNQGGVPMAANPDDGVVDHAGRVFGYDDLMVLDGSTIPISPGPNPALTILALAERAMSVVLAQREQGPIRADSDVAGRVDEYADAAADAAE